MGCPCETRTSTCRNFATISSGLYRFLAIAVLLDVKDIPQVGPLQWGRIRGRIMKRLGMLGIIGAAAILTAAPVSLQWSQTNVALSLDSAQGRPLYRYGSADCGYIPYGTSYAAPCGVYASSYALAHERLQAGYA